ncbi:MAG: glycosyl hydrolase family 28-related protein, partial [Bacteroidales bacterium]|nr:glycosyl hydrolase family 28-related protein [Bacteroidales bacterium]
MKKILLTTVISLAFVLPNQVKAKISENQGKPVIFNYNEGALPGEAFGVQGDAFGQAAELWYALVDGSEKELKPQNQLTVLSKSNINVSGLLPDEKILPKGLLIAVWVKNEQQLSEPVFINRARVVTVEFEEIMSGYPFRVFGRNLSFSGQKPSLQFYDQVKKQSFPAEIIQAESNVLQLKAPQGLVPGSRYTLKVSSGFGGKWGESEVEETMLAKESAPDPFGVGAPWGADFKFYKNIYNVRTDSRLTLKAKGNGIANDQTAIQQAIDKANADGGGVIYFPQGKYKLDFASGSGLIMRSNVVLKGEGAENSIIQYGFGIPPAYIDPIGKVGWPDETVEGVAFLWPLGTKLSGLSDLCIQNVNTSGIWRHSLKTMRPKERCPGSAGSEFFAVNCRFDLSTGCGLAWSFIDKMVVSGCDFVSYSQNTWPWMWHCDGSANFAIRNNRVHYAAGRFGFNESYNGIIENNHITRFGDLQTFKGESGGFNIDYSNDIVVMKNKMDVIGAPILSRGQGETILSQGCNPEGQTFGVVTEATATTVTDNNKQWGIFNPLLLASSRVVAIVNGKGTGQYRYIKGSKGHSIMIDRPWDVVPEPGSKYVINTWSAEDWLVKDNVLEDNDQGIMFYCGCNDVLIEGNKLTNSSGIYNRSDQRAEAGRFNLTWNTSVENNEVIRTQGTRAVSIYSLLAMQPK